MAYIIGGLAMLVSLVALWLASSNKSKIEGGNTELKAQISADVDKIRQKLEQKIDGLDKKVDAFDGKMEAVMENQAR